MEMILRKMRMVTMMLSVGAHLTLVVQMSNANSLIVVVSLCTKVSSANRGPFSS